MDVFKYRLARFFYRFLVTSKSREVAYECGTRILLDASIVSSMIA